MESKSKSTGHSKSKNPTPSPRTSRSHSKSAIPKRKVEKKNTEPTSEILNKPKSSSSKPHEVQSLILKLQGISISQEESELSQGSVTSQYIPSQPLTRAQSEKLGIPPVEFPLQVMEGLRRHHQNLIARFFHHHRPFHPYHCKVTNLLPNSRS